MRANRKLSKTEPAAATMAPVTEILVRVAEELREAAVLIERTPICTEHVKDGIGAEDIGYLRAMQGLDHSSQRLAGSPISSQRSPIGLPPIGRWIPISRRKS